MNSSEDHPFAGLRRGDRPNSAGQKRDPPALGVVHSGEIGWAVRGRRRTAAAMLVHVKNRELLVLVDENPGVEPRVTLRLTWPFATAWIAVNVLVRRRTRLGPYQLQLVPERASDAIALANIFNSQSYTN